MIKSLADTVTSHNHLTLDSTLGSVQTVEHEAESFALLAGFDADAASNVAMAARECAVNAVMHGNAYSEGKKMHAEFEITAESLRIVISDEGSGLDENSIPDPLAPENILRGSGRGIFLIRAFMDEVKFRKLPHGTEVTLIKRRAA